MSWPKYLHRKTFIAVLIADSVLVPLAYYLSSHLPGSMSTLIGLAVFVFNLPSLPLALASRILIPDEVDSVSLGIVLNVIMMLFTSYVWGIYAARQLNKKHRDFKLTRD